jgi:membrane protein DedA with SNARE-associated domain
MSKMHYRRFLLANMLGGIIWGVGYTLIGYYAGSALKKIESAASYVGIGILGVIILVLLVMHFRKKKIDEQRDNEWLAENPNALAEDEFGKEGE